MTNQPSPKQALFLWNLIISHGAEGVMQSRTSPDLTKAERSQLLDAGFLDLEKRGAAGYLTLTEKAWRWAGQATDVTLPRSRSAVGAEVLERLLRRLVPFLAQRRLALSELLPPLGASGTTAAPVVTHAPRVVAPKKLQKLIERACLRLTQGKRTKRVPLSQLRHELADVGRAELDQSLLALQDARRLVLYREDNTAALTDEDHRAALTINREPRHLVVLEASR
jgi:hypothetical protein